MVDNWKPCHEIIVTSCILQILAIDRGKEFGFNLRQTRKLQHIGVDVWGTAVLTSASGPLYSRNNSYPLPPEGLFCQIPGSVILQGIDNMGAIF